MLTSPGDLFNGRYRLGAAPLGSGQAGEVWPAFDTFRKWDVALKVLRNTEADDAWQEASRLTSLESPNILKVNNADLAIDVPFIDSELATRGTVADESKPHGVSAARAVHLTRGVLRALQLCHDRGILHRDVKPANVFIGDTGDAMLGDFGCAGVMGSDGRAKPTGDPDIRPLDVLKGLQTSASSDVYAAALCLYAMMTGALPFSIAAAGDFQQHRDNVEAGIPDVRDVAPHVSLGLAMVIRKATAPRETDRYASAEEFSAALAKLKAPKSDAARIRPSDVDAGAHLDHHRCWRVVARSGGQESGVCEQILNGKVNVTVVRPGGRRYVAFTRAGLTQHQSTVHLRSVFAKLS